jgi:predicted phage tail protein
MQLVKINNPFQRHLREVESLEFTGQSVEDLLRIHLQCIKEKQGFDLSLEYAKENIRISINGLIIPPEFWNTTKPMDNDQIVIMPIVGKGSSEKQILNIVLMIAAIYFLGPNSAFITQTLGLSGAGAFAAGTALVVGTGILINTLTPAPQAKSPNMEDWDSSQTYGWNPQTTQKQGITVPKFYGENKLYGNVIAVHTEIDDADDTKQTLKMLVSLGEGPVNGIVADSIKINDQQISNFSDVTTEERKGTLNQSAISFFGETKPEYRPNRVITNTDGAEIYTTPDADYDDLEIELVFNRGLYYANNQGGISEHSIGVKVEISIHDAD